MKVRRPKVREMKPVYCNHRQQIRKQATCLLQPSTQSLRTGNLSIATVDHEPRRCCTSVPMTCQLGQSGSDQDRTSAHRLCSSTSVNISLLIRRNRPNRIFTILPSHVHVTGRTRERTAVKSYGKGVAKVSESEFRIFYSPYIAKGHARHAIF